jgi:hypothetical protein
MKKLIGEQTGSVQVHAERKFVIEVPVDLTEGQMEQMRRRLFDAPEAEEIEWTDEDGNRWAGFDVEFVDTAIQDHDAVLGGLTVEGLKTVRLDVPVESDSDSQPRSEKNTKQSRSPMAWRWELLRDLFGHHDGRSD